MNSISCVIPYACKYWTCCWFRYPHSPIHHANTHLPIVSHTVSIRYWKRKQNTYLPYIRVGDVGVFFYIVLDCGWTWKRSKNEIHSKNSFDAVAPFKINTYNVAHFDQNAFKNITHIFTGMLFLWAQTNGQRMVCQIPFVYVELNRNGPYCEINAFAWFQQWRISATQFNAFVSTLPLTLDFVFDVRNLVD